MEFKFSRQRNAFKIAFKILILSSERIVIFVLFDAILFFEKRPRLGVVLFFLLLLFPVFRTDEVKGKAKQTGRWKIRDRERMEDEAG